MYVREEGGAGGGGVEHNVNDLHSKFWKGYILYVFLGGGLKCKIWHSQNI